MRTIESDDLATLRDLEAAIFGRAGYAEVCANYLRVCTELYSRTCLLAFEGDRPVGYLLTFVRDREAYCTRCGVLPETERSGAAIQLIATLIRTLVEDGYDQCWFTVKPDNTHARQLYRRLGAVDRGVRRDFLAPGDELLVQALDRGALVQFDDRYRAAAQ